MSFRLAFFPVSSLSGRELLDSTAEAARARGIDLEVFPDAGPGQLLLAARAFDAVVFDGTIEADGTSGYRAITGEATILDHILVVSRSYLPLNVRGLRERALPRDGLGQSVPQYPGSLTNDRIVPWIAEQLEELRSRPRDESGHDFLGLGRWSGSLAENRRRLNEQGSIFISFRAGDAAGVRELKEELEAADVRSVLYFPPGVLSSEFMTEQRRWQVVSLIRDRMLAADEAWIYDSSGWFEDYYYNSWWTLAELVTLAYLGERRPRVRIYDAAAREARDAPDDFLPRLDEAQKNRLARWFANSTPDEMGPENVPLLRQIRSAPLLGGLVEGTFYGDYVWSEEFWHHPVLDCPRCRSIGHARNRFEVDDVLYTRGPSFTRYLPADVEACLRNGRLACRNPRCCAVHRFEQGRPQYLWTPLGNAETLAAMVDGLWQPRGPWLLELPTYLIR